MPDAFACSVLGYVAPLCSLERLCKGLFSHLLDFLLLDSVLLVSYSSECLFFFFLGFDSVLSPYYPPNNNTTTAAHPATVHIAYYSLLAFLYRLNIYTPPFRFNHP
ncbi:hypothetical protein C8R43DRAFT_1136048 [Mycena crocata]|nr:hypothetical protein C8R43DRAFT_1136048 [Mycena crocata]